MALRDILQHHEVLDPRHRRALEWFLDHEGQLVPWPAPLGDGTLLATKAKGIYKPQWSRYALSVRQTLDGPYPDHAIEYLPDGSWLYKYYQEKLDVEEGSSLFTNKGLRECLKDAVPVGVLIQKSASPTARYLVQGLAFVGGWGDGFFSLCGIPSSLAASGVPALGRVSTPAQVADAIADLFDPRLVDDERRKVTRTVLQRRGQVGFRRILLDAYESKCVVTAYDAVDSLEAAHIVPYRGPVTNNPSNGLLLRADLHSLFDLGLLAVHESELCVVLSKDLLETRYKTLSGTQVARPGPGFPEPSREALKQHRTWAEL